MKVEADDTLQKIVSSLKAGLINDNIKWTNPDNIHITLVFLGDIEDGKIKPVAAMLKGICEGYGKFELILKGSGVFKNLHDPRIIWTGIEHSEKLIQLNESIINGLKNEGFEIEGRPFNPHLTLGRIKTLKDKSGLKFLIEKYQNTEIQKVPVNDIVFYESILLQSGRMYKPLGKFKL